MAEEKNLRKVAEYKIKTVDEIAKKMKDSKTVLIASVKGLPGSQFHAIKKKLRGKAEIQVAKKSLVSRALQKSGKGALQNLKEQLSADIAIFFSDLDAFELSALLSESQSEARAKAGDLAPEDIKIEPGPTDLVPGPAISELSGVGLKVAVEDGKLAIKTGATVVKEGQPIDEKLASVLGKLNIAPMKVGFVPVAAYDSESDKVYVGIKIDKEETLNELRNLIGKALGFATSIEFVTKETISQFIAKAAMEEKALAALSPKSEAKEESKEEDKPADKKEEEKSEEEAKPEEPKAESNSQDETNKTDKEGQ